MRIASFHGSIFASIRLRSMVVVLFLTCIMFSCGKSKSERTQGAAVSLDIKSSLQNESEPLAIGNVNITPLDSANAEAFFSRGNLIDVIGDTILIHENHVNSRVLKFSASTGKYLGQINHRGEGPEEYRLMFSAIVDKASGNLMVPLIDRPAVLNYSLSNDSFVSEKPYKSVDFPLPAFGRASSCINISGIQEKSFVIYQYDGDFNTVDSIVMPDFTPGDISTYMGTADDKGVVLLGDTLYNVDFGKLQPMAIMSRGDQGLTVEKEREVMLRALESNESELELLKPYIIVRDVQATGNHIAVTTMSEGCKTTGIYRLDDGELVYSNTYPEIWKKSEIVLNAGGDSVTVHDIFARDGRWYGFEEESTDGMTNNTLVSFSLPD